MLGQDVQCSWEGNAKSKALRHSSLKDFCLLEVFYLLEIIRANSKIKLFHFTVNRKNKGIFHENSYLPD